MPGYPGIPRSSPSSAEAPLTSELTSSSSPSPSSTDAVSAVLVELDATVQASFSQGTRAAASGTSAQPRKANASQSTAAAHGSVTHSNLWSWDVILGLDELVGGVLAHLLAWLNLLETIIICVGHLEASLLLGRRRPHGKVIGGLVLLVLSRVQLALLTKTLSFNITLSCDLFGTRFIQQAHVTAVQQLGHELACLKAIKAKGFELDTKVGVVLSDDLDDDTDTNSQRVATAKHVTDQLLDAWLGDKLTGKLVRTDALLLVLGGVGRDSDDGFDEVTSSGLNNPVVLGTKAGEEARDNVFGVQPLDK
ncbi:hypothetical protein HG531_013266 [Fusarium graminearum]|nr:hypothetical protein HG531_013266 [Fusarium graminearum]